MTKCAFGHLVHKSDMKIKQNIRNYCYSGESKQEQSSWTLKVNMSCVFLAHAE